MKEYTEDATTFKCKSNCGASLSYLLKDLICTYQD